MYFLNCCFKCFAVLFTLFSKIVLSHVNNNISSRTFCYLGLQDFGKGIFFDGTCLFGRHVLRGKQVSEGNLSTAYRMETV